MLLKLKKILFFAFPLVIFCAGNLTAQSVYYHYKDTVTVAKGGANLVWSIYNESLLQAVADQDSVSIWMLEVDSCLSGGFSGIPYCQSCSAAANMVLQTAYKISYIDKKVISGSCWDYLNGVFTRIESGSYKKYDVFFEKKEGPYAPKSMLQPGDWVYHVNYQYYQIEHSAIFVCWKDYEQGTAITLSYMGMNRWKTAEFGEYNLNSVYAIFRMQDELW